MASSRSPGWKTFEIKKLEFLLIRFEIVFLLQHPQLQLRQAWPGRGEATIEKESAVGVVPNGVPFPVPMVPLPHKGANPA